MAMPTPTYQNVLKAVEDVPSLPQVYNRLMTALNNPLSTADQVSKIISTDSGITSRVLKLVNSAFYGFPSQITSITRAVVILGFNEVRNMVITTSVIGSFMRMTAARKDDAMQLWKHGLAAAIISRQLAQRLNLPDHEDIFVAGLLHDIGKMVQMCVFPKDHGLIVDRARFEDRPLQTIELDHFGFDHAYTARVIMKAWGLPPSLVFTASRHHRPRVENKMKRSVACVHVADVISHALKIVDMDRVHIPRIDRQVWQSMGLPATVMDELREDALVQLEDICRILEID